VPLSLNQMIAVGMLIAKRAPHRLERARLRHSAPPWVFDGEASKRARMKNAGPAKKVICQLFDPIAGDLILPAASLERTPPKVGDMVSEPAECSTVGRHRVIKFQSARICVRPGIDGTTGK
jgi:hypothetical protein